MRNMIIDQVGALPLLALQMYEQDRQWAEIAQELGYALGLEANPPCLLAASAFN